jgi:hypothetical protein
MFYLIRCKVELLSFGLTLLLQSVGNIPMDVIVALDTSYQNRAEPCRSRIAFLLKRRTL